MLGRSDAEIQALLRRGGLPAGLRVQIALEIVATYAEVRCRLAGSDITKVVRVLRGRSANRHAAVEARRMGVRLGRPVRRTLDPLPFDSRCLMRSLVLLRMLSRRGVLCDLVIGVRPGEAFQAHAWIEYEGLPLLPTLAYQPLTVL